MLMDIREVQNKPDSNDNKFKNILEMEEEEYE
jgi:hypothetical protein